MKFQSSYNVTAQPHVVDEQLQRLYRDRVQMHSFAGSILASLLNRLVEHPTVPFQLTFDGRSWKLELV